MDDPFRLSDADPMSDVPVPPLPYASWARRMFGALIDVLAMSAIAAPLTLERVARVIDDTASNADVRYVTIVSLIIQVAYMTSFHTWRGATPGKMAMRTVLRRSDGTPVDANIAFVRSVVLATINFVSNFLVLVPMLVNALRPLWHPRRQTWHDQVARTVVLRVTADEPPAYP